MNATRHLAAILAIEVDSYSRLMAEDEERIHDRLKVNFREIIDPKIYEHRGRIVKDIGIQTLAEFSSVVDAVRCAAEIQRGMVDRNADMPEGRGIRYHVGINAGDVIEEPEDIYGDSVNLAARLATLAEGGAICVSEIVYEEVRHRVQYDFEDIGEHFVKNIARAVRVFTLYPGTIARLPTSPLPLSSLVPPRTPPRRLSIVVLPFINLSNDSDQQYLADGITEDLTTELSRLAEMFVISRRTAFTYRNTLIHTKQIGRQLGVRYVLEGTVRRLGNRVRITTQLVDAESDLPLWVERYDRNVTEFLDLQSEIATAILGAIEPELLKSERERIASRPQRNDDAYELYQRGLFHHYRQTKTDNAEAQHYFRRALEIDPQYAQATAALSIALCSAGITGWTAEPDIYFDQAYEHAEQAVRLDRRNPRSHFALGLACMWTHRPDQATVAFLETIELNPSFAAAHVLLGQMYLYAGRPKEAIAQVEKGIRLSPNDPRLFIWLVALAGAHYMLQNYEQAIEAGRRSWILNHNWPAGLSYVVAGLARLGRMSEAHAALTKLRLLNPDLAFIEHHYRRLYQDQAAVDHILDGLRKAGFE